MRGAIGIRALVLAATAAIAVVGLLAWLLLRSPAPNFGGDRSEATPSLPTISDGQALVGMRPETHAESLADDSRAHPSASQGPAPTRHAIRFRVVDTNDVAVARAQVVLKMAGPPGTKTSVLRGIADERGQFSESQNCRPDCRAITVIVASAAGESCRLHHFEAPDPLPEVWDVGDLGTQITRACTLFVYDADGKPIANAAVSISEQASGPLRTDSAGHVELSLALGAVSIEVTSKGFVSKTIDIPRKARVGRVLEVVLDATGELTIHVSPDPHAELQASILVSYAQDGSTKESDRKTQQGVRASDAREDAPSGAYFFHELPPAIALRAEVQSLGTVLGSLDVAPLEAGEHRLVELRVDARPEPLTLTVIGPDGEAVQGAWIELTSPSDMTQSRMLQTDSEGDATFASYRPVVLDIRVSASGYAHKTMVAVAISDESFRIHLDRERTVIVELLKPDGSPATARNVQVSALMTNYGAIGDCLEPGRWQLKGLPSGEIVITVDPGGGSILHDSSIPTAKVVTGYPGQVWAKIDVDETTPLALWAVGVHSLRHPRYSTRAFLGRQPDPKKSAIFFGLPHGPYQLQIERLSNGEHPTWQPWSAAVTVDVGEGRVDVNLGR